MHILCATDLTDRSIAAVRRAGGLARRTGGKLTLIHVVSTRRPVEGVGPHVARRYAELMAAATAAAGPNAPFVDLLIRRGNLLEVIARTASARDVDLVVVAAPRVRRLESIVGTTAERLVRSSGRSVLVVRGDVSRDYDRVAIAADMTTASGPMLRTAVRIAALDGAYATVVHAMHAPYDGIMRTAGLEDSTIELYHRGFEEDARHRLRALAVEAGLPVHTSRVVVSRREPVHAIRDVVELDRPELLVLGASRWFLIKRLLMGSVADQVLRTARCDVLVIPHRRGASAPDLEAPRRIGGNAPPAAGARTLRTTPGVSDSKITR